MLQIEEERKLITEVFGEEMDQEIERVVQAMVQDHYPADRVFEDIEELESDKLMQTENYYWGE